MKKILKFKWFIFLGIILFTSVSLFSASYFFDQVIELPLLLAIYFIIAFLFGIVQSINIVKKLLLISVTFVITVIIGIALLLVTIELPGSKNHDYIMYKVCLPALDKYYANKRMTPKSPANDKNKEGKTRWWVQHAECEKNVQEGKGPNFSKNPPGFPVIK